MKSQPFVTSALHKNFILSAASIILFFSNIVCAEQLTLETGKCYPKDVVNRSLKADGQQLLLNGNRHYYSKEQIDILGKQIIRTTTDGRKITALDSVRGIDSVLDDWDNSFAEMVKEGIAKQYEKEKVSKGYEAMGGESVSDDNSYYNGF